MCTRPPTGLAPLSLPLAMLLLVAVALAAGCAKKPPPPSELRDIGDPYFDIAHPGILGASATGEGCAVTRREALTSAERVAHFNLRRLTGPARYNVRYRPVGESHTDKGVCVVVSAESVEAKPYNR